MSYLATFYALLDPRTRGRVAMCAYKLAQDVLNEAPDAKDHDRRAALARAVEADPLAHGEQILLEVLTNPTVAASASEDGTLGASDSDLEYVITTRWLAIADRVAARAESE